MTDIALPAGFQDLEPLAARWARPTENERNAIRLSAAPGDFVDFDALMAPRLEALLAHLATLPARPEDPADYNALLLAAAFAEAAPHHELYGDSAQVPFSFDARRFTPDHGTEAT
ncbi:hypothetical protein [Sphingomonas colocasiae]|uniref:Uncharacterized protein n=1 Tax=Sphingomonas colocasiae TaxID=1848973 RepID=A0ABS7PYH6_9SPHN|nr:hypothetical protein [Sphingomonas colocasiae]MBY8825705.1 hypothetical protein [Sphingomonas colocasiae]